MWAHKEGSQPEHKAIEHGEIRRTLSGAIADQELMFEQERFSYDLARSARAEEFREGHEQMDRQEEQIAHELETILPANLHKTAPRRRFMPNLPIRHPQASLFSLDNHRWGRSGKAIPRLSILASRSAACIFISGVRERKSPFLADTTERITKMTLKF